MEHPFGGSWGYQVTSYFAPTSRFGDPDDFRYLVDALHQAGIGVIVDWVPGALPQGRVGAGPLRRHPALRGPEPAARRAPGLGHATSSTSAAREVRNFLVANALYWLEEFHVDGLRVDAVASMLYLDYSREDGRVDAERVRRPGEPRGGGVPAGDERDGLQAGARASITIAEESTAWPGVTRPTHLGRPRLRLQVEHGLDARHARLRRSNDPIHRQYHHDQMTFSLVYAYSENYVLPISHDEVVHGKGSLLRKMPGDRWQQLANLRAYLAFMWAHPGKQLLFMGSEFGQESEWAEARELDWWLLDHPEHRGVHDAGARPEPGLHASTPALWSRDNDPAGFQWIDANDAGNNVFAFIRTPKDAGDGPLVCVANFSAVPHEGYRLGLPHGRRAGTRCSTPTPRPTAAPASATSAASRPWPSRGTGSRPPRRSRLPRSAPSGSCTRAEGG